MPLSKTQKKTNKTRKRVKTEMTESPEPAQLEVVAEVETIQTPAEAESVHADEKQTTKRKVPTKESVIEEVETLLQRIETEIQVLRESSTRSKGVKFLRSIDKNLKTIKGRMARVMKNKTRRQQNSTNKNSGFLKPVPISREMAKFTGWDASQLHSRVEVTKFICKYIKENNLQNPKDRRQINPDAKLQKLLGFNPKKEKEPLRYYSLQTYLKHHFPVVAK